MSDTRFGVIVVTVAFAAILTGLLLMSAVEWLQALNVRKQLYAGRHARAGADLSRPVDEATAGSGRPEVGPGQPEEPLPVLEGRQERAGWWQRITRDDEFDGDHRDGRDVIEAVDTVDEDAWQGPAAEGEGRAFHGLNHADNDVPRLRPETGTGGRAESERATAPGYHHDDDVPAQVVPAVRLSDGSYAGLSGTIPANLPRPGPMPDVPGTPGARSQRPGPGQPHRSPQPYPHAGPAAWHPQRTWVTDLVEAALGCADSDAWEQRWRWAWQQQRRLAIT
jgi:hypothetical protein